MVARLLALVPVIFACTSSEPRAATGSSAPKLIAEPRDVSVDHLLADPARGRLRVRAPVVPGSVMVDGEGRHRFDLAGTTGQLQVEYVGVLPESFRDDSDVVVEGRLAEPPLAGPPPKLEALRLEASEILVPG